MAGSTDISEGLIRCAQKGDANAFETLLGLIYDLIYRFAFKWSGNRHDAEDITQQVCIKLARVISQFRFDSNFTTWLYRIVINCAHDWRRGETKHSSVTRAVENDVNDDHEDIAPGPADTFETTSNLEQTLNRVDAMGKGFKETLLLVFAEGLSHREAASILNIKESTVSWRIHEIRKNLSISAVRTGEAR